MSSSVISDAADPQGSVDAQAISWAPEMMVRGNGGKWSRNGLRFATEAEALGNAQALMWRWTMCEDCRAMPAPEPVNYRYEDGNLVALPVAAVAA